MPFKVPSQLDTERLRLRLFGEQDWDTMALYYGDAEINQYTSGKTLNRDESWRAIACMIGHWQIHGYGPYALEHRETGKVIGVSGFWYPGGWPEPEIKWGLLRQYWGQGYAGEAAQAVLKAGNRYLPDIHLISLIHHNNQASIKLALSLGAHFEQEIDFWWDRFRIYRHRKDDCS